MVKFQIVGGSLVISNGDTRLSVTPTKDIAIDSIALYDPIPKATLYNSSVGNNEVIFNQVLSEILDENDDVFTVRTFIDYAVANFGLVKTSLVPSTITSSSTKAFRLISTTTTNAVVVKNTQGNLYTIVAIGLTEDVRFLKFYDKATAPTVGTDEPVLTIPVPTNLQGAGVVIPLSFGLGFSNGIALALTSGSSDGDTGAIGSGDVILNLTYA